MADGQTFMYMYNADDVKKGQHRVDFIYFCFNVEIIERDIHGKLFNDY